MRNAKKIIVILLLFTITHISVSAQTGSGRRAYVAGRFGIELDRSKGLVQPVKHGDTLVYTLNNLADSLGISKKFDSTYGAAGKRYILVYKKKKVVSIKKPG